MTVLNDIEIFRRCTRHKHVSVADDDLIVPLIEGVEIKNILQTEANEFGQKVFGYGIDSYGYDARLAGDLRLFTNVNSSEPFDPKRPSEKHLVDLTIHSNDLGERWVIMPPNSFMLGSTVERFNVDRDLVVLVLGKSTYARAGIIVNPTVLKPEWSGNVVLEFSNTTGVPVKVYVDEAVATFIFLKANSKCVASYLERGGKYNGQQGTTLGRV